MTLLLGHRLTLRSFGEGGWLIVVVAAGVEWVNRSYARIGRVGRKGPECEDQRSNDL